MLQQKRLPLGPRQPPEGAVDFFPERLVFLRVRYRERLDPLPAGGAEPIPPQQAAAAGPTPVHQNAKGPGTEPLRLPAAGEPPIGAQEGVLQRLLGFFPRAEHLPRIAAELRPELRHQRRERSQVAALDPGYHAAVVCSIKYRPPETAIGHTPGNR